MNTITMIGFGLVLTALPVSVSAGQARGETPNEQSWTGALTGLNMRSRTFTGKNLWLGKTFNVGQKCAISTLEKENGALGDLSAGEEVNVRYQDVDGVLVADRIQERALHCNGTVQGIDQKTRMLTMAEPPLLQPFRSPKPFRMAVDSQVLLSSGAKGTLANVEPGDRISLIYNTPNGSSVVYRLRDNSLSFVGALDALNLPARSIEAGENSKAEKFDLADNCRVLLSGDKTGHLKDLRLGQKYRLTYQEVNGIRVVDRIAPVPEPKPAETASVR